MTVEEPNALIEALDEQQPEESRPAAVAAFGHTAAHADLNERRHAADLLVDLTRDADRRVRMRAGAALASLELPTAIPALEGLKRREPKQEGPRIERWIAQLRKGGEGDEIQKMREQMEKLEGKYRKLEERIQDLEMRQMS